MLVDLEGNATAVGVHQFGGLALTQADDPAVTGADAALLEDGLITSEIRCEDHLVLTVRDYGNGIPEYATEKIFDRFYALARPTSQKKRSGLGLCFVKQITDRHHGGITVENQQDAGVLVTGILTVSR